MSNDDETDLIGKRGTDEEYEREDMLPKDFGTEIAPYRDGHPGNEEWSEACEGGEDGEALGAASMDDILRAICFKTTLASVTGMNPNSNYRV